MGNSASKRLGDYCQLRNGYAFKSGDFVDDGIPVVRISDIQDGGIDLTDTVKVKPKDDFEKFSVSKGDILIAMSGATTGKYGVFDSSQKAYQNQRVGCFVIKDKKQLDNRFLYFLISQLKAKIESEAYGGGQPNISASKIEDYKIDIPHLEDQIRIANILSKAEALISQCKESLRLLDEFLKSTFLEMFGDPVRNEKEWKEEKLFEVLTDIKAGWSPVCEDHPRDDESQLAILKLSAVTYGEFNPKANKKLKPETEVKKRIEPNKGDVLFSRKNTLDLVGATAFVFRDYPNLLLSDTIFKLEYDKSKVNGLFLWKLLSNGSVRTAIQKLATGSAGSMPNISQERLLSFKTILPPLKLQIQFAHIVEKTEALKAHYQSSLQELENLYGSLSQRAFSGKLVPLHEGAGGGELAMAAEPKMKYGKSY